MRGVVKITVVILTGCFLLSGNHSRFAVGQAVKPEPQKEDVKAALVPLARFLGNWDKKYTIYKSELVRADVTRTGKQTCKWILNERSLEESGQDSDGSSYVTIYSWDATTKDYRMFTFKSNGDILHLTGKWDAQTTTFNWTTTLYDGTIVTASNQFTSANENKMSFVAKRGDKVTYRLDGTVKRIEDKK